MCLGGGGGGDGKDILMLRCFNANMQYILV